MFESSNEQFLGMVDHGRFNQVSLLRELQQGQPLVYAIETREGAIKIGVTNDLAMRKRTIKFGGTRRILAFKPGDLSVERGIHSTLDECRIFGTREYYYPAAEVLAAVNWMREYWGLRPIPRRQMPRLANCTFHRRVMEAQAAGGAPCATS